MLFELLKLSCSGSTINFCMSKNNQSFKHEQPGISHSVSKYIYYWDHKKTVCINSASLYKLYKLTSLWGKVAKQKMNKMIFLKTLWAFALLHRLKWLHLNAQYIPRSLQFSQLQLTSHIGFWHLSFMPFMLLNFSKKFFQGRIIANYKLPCSDSTKGISR